MAARRTVFQGVALAAVRGPCLVRCVIDKLAGMVAQIFGECLLIVPGTMSEKSHPLTYPRLTHGFIIRPAANATAARI